MSDEHTFGMSAFPNTGCYGGESLNDILIRNLTAERDKWRAQAETNHAAWLEAEEARAESDAEGKHLVEEKLRFQVRASLYQCEFGKALDAVSPLREDKSLGLNIGDCLFTDGIPALIKKRDEAHAEATYQVQEKLRLRDELAVVKRLLSSAMKLMTKIAVERNRYKDALQEIAGYQGLFGEDDPVSVAEDALEEGAK